MQHLSKKILIAVLWVLALLMAMGLSAMIPPMQSPDENSHITRAYLISQGHLLMQSLPTDFSPSSSNQATDEYAKRAILQGGYQGGMIDQSLLDFVESYMALAGQPAKRISSAEKQRLAQLQWTGSKRYHLLPGAGYYFPAIYAPQALGLRVGQALELSVQHSYQIARVFTLVACFAALWLAFGLLTPNAIVCAIVLLPMTLFQLMSPTIDGLTTSLAVLAISLFLTSLAPGRPHSWAKSWGLILCIFLIATSRTHLLPLLSLPFFLAWKRSSRQDFFLGCGLAALVIVWTLFALQSATDVRVVRDHTTAQLLALYAGEPGAFATVVYASLADPAWFAYVQQSFIGALGWLDAWLPKDFYPALWFGLGLCAAASVSMASMRTDWSARLLLVGVALASVILIFLALLVTWTPYPARVVHGVQGRYFVVPALLLAYACSGILKVETQARRWLGGFMVAGFSWVSLTALVTTLFNRYQAVWAG